MSDAFRYETPNDPQAILAVLLKGFEDGQISKEQMRRFRDGMALLGDNFDQIQSVVNTTSQFFPVLPSDPTETTDGQVWVNSTAGTVKIVVNGVVKTFTIT
jgi:hypothetical protein